MIKIKYIISVIFLCSLLWAQNNDTSKSSDTYFFNIDEYNRVNSLILNFSNPSQTNTLRSEDIDIFEASDTLNYTLSNFDEANPLADEAKLEYEQENISAAKDLYISALQHASNAEWYYELGEILYDLKNYEEAKKSYFLAGELNYKRKDLAYYNSACTASLQDISSGLEYFKLALRSGYKYWNHISQDSDLDHIRNESEFQSLINQFQAIYQNYDTTSLDLIDLEWISNSYSETKRIVDKSFTFTAEYRIVQDKYIQHYQIESNGTIYMQNTDVFDKKYISGDSDYYYMGISDEIQTFNDIPDYLLQQVIYTYYYNETLNPDNIKAIEDHIREYVRNYKSYIVLAGVFSPQTYIYYPDKDTFIRVYSP